MTTIYLRLTFVGNGPQTNLLHRDTHTQTDKLITITLVRMRAER